MLERKLYPRMLGLEVCSPAGVSSWGHSQAPHSGLGGRRSPNLVTSRNTQTRPFSLKVILDICPSLVFFL